MNRRTVLGSALIGAAASAAGAASAKPAAQSAARPSGRTVYVAVVLAAQLRWKNSGRCAISCQVPA